MNISELVGDGTGALHVLPTQEYSIPSFNYVDAPANAATNSTPLPASILISPNSSATLPKTPVAITQSTTLQVNGTICGTNSIFIMDGGVLALSTGGSTCGASPGTYVIDQVVVYAGGVITSTTPTPTTNSSTGGTNSTGGSNSTDTSSPPPVTITGTGCGFQGGNITGVNIGNLWNESDATNYGVLIYYFL